MGKSAVFRPKSTKTAERHLVDTSRLQAVVQQSLETSYASSRFWSSIAHIMVAKGPSKDEFPAAFQD